MTNPAANSSPRLPLPAWDAWRAANTERLASLLWKPLQKLGEANKAGLLVEVAACGGELAVAMSARIAWRDLFAIEEEGDLLARGAGRRANDPALHRLDFARSRHCSDSPSLPIWTATASGLYALGSLSRSTTPSALLTEYARVLRPGGALLLAEPVGGFLSGIPAELRVDIAPFRDAATNAAAPDGSPAWAPGATWTSKGGFALFLAHRCPNAPEAVAE